MLRFLKGALAATFLASPACAEPLGLGREALPEEIAAWDIDVRPDGLGLPEGRGNVADGEEIFAEFCASCHGDFGEAVGRWPVLAGGHDTLTDERPEKTIGSYWPYLSTVWDYINRAMPFGNAQSLSPDEVYAITAYLMYVNDLVEDDFELNQENFLEVHLPNEENFFMDDRESVEVPTFTRKPCMSDCKQSVEITARAMIVDVTPEEASDAAAEAEGAAKVKVVETAAETVQTASSATTSAAATAVVAAATAAGGFDADLAASGEKVYKKCKSCHQIGAGAKNKTGPILTGIVDSPAGQVDGFKKYSKALKSAAGDGLIWDEASLDAFLTKPKSFMKGTKMSFAGLKKEADRKAIIEYLKSVGQ